jgi:hypothetical protein
MRDRLLRYGARVAPARLAASIDHLRIGLPEEFGGPFNGQERRIDAVREIFKAIRFAAIVETGTYRATTTLFLRGLSDVPIATIEVQPRFYHYAKRRLRDLPDLHLILGDSADELPSLAKSSPWNIGPVFFYLDAHWLDALPLYRELEAIVAGWRAFVIVVDDFRVPHDPGYSYDDYGPGNVLEPSILGPFADSELVVFWPGSLSSDETGARRGWIVLASGGPMDAALSRVRSLSRAGSVASVLEVGSPPAATSILA